MLATAAVCGARDRRSRRGVKAWRGWCTVALMERLFEIISPIDGAARLRTRYLTPDEGLHRLAKAELAQRAWRETSVEQRGLVCLAFVDAYEQQLEHNVLYRKYY